MRHIEILTYTLLCLGTSFEIPNFKSRHFLHRDMKCGMICLSHAVLNGRKCIKQHSIQHFLSWLLLKNFLPTTIMSVAYELRVLRRYIYM